jgi:hypothetical protein
MRFLDFAIGQYSLKSIQLLLNKGAKELTPDSCPNVVDAGMRRLLLDPILNTAPPFHHYTEPQAESFIKQLIARQSGGFPASQIVGSGACNIREPLADFTFNASTDYFKFLLSIGMVVDATDSRGLTAFDGAVASAGELRDPFAQRMADIRRLHDAGASITHRDQYGFLPVDFVYMSPGGLTAGYCAAKLPSANATQLKQVEQLLISFGSPPAKTPNQKCPFDHPSCLRC